MTRWGLAIAAAAIACLAVAFNGRLREWGYRAGVLAPPQVRVETVTANLIASFDDEAAVSAPADSAVCVGRVKLTRRGQDRRGILAPPPSIVRFRPHVRPGAILRFGIGVARPPGARHTQANAADAAVRFIVRAGGREVFARQMDPARRRDDRRWFDGRVALDVPQEGEMEIELSARVVGETSRISGTPVWSQVRIVDERVTDRQLRSARTPNVLMLVLDTLRADSLGCYGASPSPSPTLDHLARHGLVFDAMVAQASWTLPSVASFFTGLHPRSHGLVGAAAVPGAEFGVWTGQKGADPTYLSDGLRTLAADAQAAGISTFGVSANPLVSHGTNLARGFEEFIEFEWGRRRRRAEHVNKAFFAWLDQHRGRRFLAYLHYIDTHGPYSPPPEYRPAAPPGVRPDVARGKVGRARLLSTDGPPLTPEELDHLRTLYRGEIRYWDAQLEQLLAGLSAAGVLESTIILFTSDHGEAFLEHGRLGHGVHLYDELIRVPLVITGPSVPAGRRGPQAQGIDLYPTVAAMLGIEPPAALPGQNLLRPTAARAAFSEHPRGADSDGTPGGRVSVRTTTWKLIHEPGVDRFELYDLARDPAERHDLFGKDPMGEELRLQLADWSAGAPAPPATNGHDPDFQDRLRALGYVE